MKVTHLKKDAVLPTLQTALAAINGRYDCNIEVNQFGSADPRRFTLRVKSSKGPGARRSRHGRRTVSACWHVHRDFLTALFDLEPGVTVYTALAMYRGRDGFLRDFPQTAYTNVGSVMRNGYIVELCACGE